MDIKEIYALFQQHSTICTDSRKIWNGAMFISLKGENFNGNKYSYNRDYWDKWKNNIKRTY